MPGKPKPASLLELHLLDSFRLERAGKIISLPTRKSESLLAYLALDPESHAREKLAALFWGDFSDLQARTSLRTALAVLRKHLGDEVILADRDTLQINLACFRAIDTLEFARALNLQNAQSRQAEIESLQAAIAWYRCDLLSDFYDEWIPVAREHYRSLYLNALLSLTQKMRARSEYDRAMDYARMILQTDPANESAHQHLMFCYVATGRRSEAIKQYAECQWRLREELGVAPSSETQMLFESIQRAQDAPVAREAVLTNLPAPVTSFIGREQEVIQVKQLFARARLLTLTGVGGIGKTRLAKQIAFELVSDFRDGAWLVELVELTDSALVPFAVAKTMGVREASDGSVETVLARALASRQALMVLDNCEHLVESCARLCEQLLGACPHLKILVTSREILGIPGETIWRVPPLKLPESAARADPANVIMEFDAVRLFVERATLASPSFDLNDRNASAVMQICQRLDGIPLALELAAARVKTMSVEQIANKLDDRFRLLTGGSRTAMPRYQTLRALIDWSYDMLSEDERVLFRRLSVFWGGWTLEAAEQVCGGEWLANGHGEARHRPPNVLDLLGRLVDKSLVLMDDHQGETRFRFLETIRQYARDMLMALDEATMVRDCHRDWFLQLTEQVEPCLRSSEQLNGLNRLEQEHENLRAALEWSLGREGTVADAEKALRMVGALTQFWAMHGYLSEGRNWIDLALKQAEHAHVDDHRIKAWALSGGGVLALLQGDAKHAAEYCQTSLALARKFQDPWLIGASLYVLGEYARNYEHDFPQAQAIMSEGLALARETGDHWLIALMLYGMGANAELLGDLQLAIDFLEEALSLCREMGEVWLRAAIVNELGEQAFLQNDLVRAASLYEEGLRLRRELRDISGEAGSLNNLGEVARAQGDFDRAKSLFDASLAMFNGLGQQASIAILWHNLGYIAKHHGDLGRARAYLQDSIALFGKLGDTEGIADCLAGLASVAVEKADYERAARLLGACQTILQTIGAHLSPTDQHEFDHNVAAVHRALGDVEFQSVLQQGRAFSMAMALALALAPG